ncbi:MAG: ABC transporter ATP-binding protein [Pseudomonadota bacterium]
MSEPLLSVSKLTKSFGTRHAVDNVSFRVEKGQTLGLIGPNGAGKSTTVAMICGLLRPDNGDVRVDGLSMATDANAAKQKIGLVPQDLALFDDLSARENLKLFGALYGLSGTQLRTRCDEALALVQLSDRANDKPSTFSGGMKRRLNIAAALLHDPQLLILDEPTVGVDPQSRNAIFECLEALRAKGRSLIYTSHYMEEVERLADHIVIVDHGRVIADESPAALHRRLPAQAALHVELAQLPEQAMVAALAQQTGVSKVDILGNSLQIGLLETAHGLPLLAWLEQMGCRPLHFATAKTNLEDIFLTLTGRTLRD